MEKLKKSGMEWNCRKEKEQEMTWALFSSDRFSIVSLNKPLTGVTV